MAHVFECDEGEGEGLHGVGLLLVVEDHPVRGQVEAAGLLAGEGRGRLPREVHRHVVAEEEDAVRSISGSVEGQSSRQTTFRKIVN